MTRFRIREYTLGYNPGDQSSDDEVGRRFWGPDRLTDKGKEDQVVPDIVVSSDGGECLVNPDVAARFSKN